MPESEVSGKCTKGLLLCSMATIYCARCKGQFLVPKHITNHYRWPTTAPLQPSHAKQVLQEKILAALTPAMASMLMSFTPQMRTLRVQWEVLPRVLWRSTKPTKARLQGMSCLTETRLHLVSRH